MENANHLPTTTAPVTSLVPASRGASDELQQFLIFTLNGEAFALDILQIREIIEYGQMTEVPMMPEAIRGVINLRGAVVPVVDLSARFGRTRTEVGRRTCIVILEVPASHDDEKSQVLGIVVDGVNEVMEIPAGDIEPAPNFGVRLRTDFIAGMGRVSGRFVIILDLPRVLSMDELAQLAAMARLGGNGTAAGAEPLAA